MKQLKILCLVLLVISIGYLLINIPKQNSSVQSLTKALDEWNQNKKKDYSGEILINGNKILFSGQKDGTLNTAEYEFIVNRKIIPIRYLRKDKKEYLILRDGRYMDLSGDLYKNKIENLFIDYIQKNNIVLHMNHTEGKIIFEGSYKVVGIENLFPNGIEKSDLLENLVKAYLVKEKQIANERNIREMIAEYENNITINVDFSFSLIHDNQYMMKMRGKIGDGEFLYTINEFIGNKSSIKEPIIQIEKQISIDDWILLWSQE